MSSDETQLSKLNSWLSLAKNLAWIIGLAGIALYKFQQQENINLNQDIQLIEIAKEHNKLDEKLHKLEETSLSCNIMISNLKSQLIESERRATQREYRR